MTTIYNLHNCAAWQTGQAYTLGQTVSNGASPVKAYRCTTPGTSSGTGPTGTGSSIADGTVVWKYLSSVDFTTISAALAGIGTLTAPTELWFWNDAEWVTANAVTTISGHSTTATNTLTLRAAPGESFRDATGASGNPLRYDQSKGVAIKSGYNYGSSLIVNEGYVTYFGLQMRGTGSTGSAVIGDGTSASNFVVDSCILDQGQTDNGSRITDAALNSNVVFRNCVMIAGSVSQPILAFFSITFYNCTIARAAWTAPTGTAVLHNYSGVTAVNTAIFGFTTLQTGTGTNTFTNCATDLTSPPTGFTRFTYASQFQDTGTTAANRDFRLKAGAGLIDAGTTDTTDVPTGVDIYGSTRSTWDIGAYETVSAAVAAALASSAVGNVAATAGLSTNIRLAATASDVVSSTSSLTTSIRLAASAIDVSAATGILSTNIRLAAIATDASAVTGSLSTAITLQASAVGIAVSTSNITTSIKLAATANSVSSTTSILSTPSLFAADAHVVGNSTSALTTGIVLGSNAANVVTINGNLTTGISLAASASLISAATSNLTTSSLFGAGAQAVVSSASVLTTGISLRSNASNAVNITADLTTGITLAGHAFGVVSASIDGFGNSTTLVITVGTALAEAYAFANTQAQGKKPMPGIINVLTDPRSTRLTSLDIAKADLGITDSSQDAQIQALIDRASGLITTYCGRVLAAQTVAETFHYPHRAGRRGVYGNGYGYGSVSSNQTQQSPLILSLRPVTEIISVTVDRYGLDPDNDFEVDTEAGILYRLSGSARAGWYGSKVVVQYTAGYSTPGDGSNQRTLPFDIEEVVLKLVRKLYYGIATNPSIVLETAEGVGSIRYDHAAPLLDDDLTATLESYRNMEWAA